jgi:hypothetical protein
MVYGVLDDVLVVEFLQDCDLSECGRRNSFIFSVHSDHLHCHDLLGPFYASLEDAAVGTFAELDQQVHLNGSLHPIQVLITKIGS